MTSASTMRDRPERAASSGRDWRWWTSLGLAAIGFIDSVYLTWIKLADQTASCGSIGDCESVNNSRYAEVAGIPIALFGAAAYLLIILLLVLDRRGGAASEPARLAIFGVTLAGTIYSIYLTYLELFVLKAVCPFCVVSAIAILGLFLLSLTRLGLWGRPPVED